MQQNETLQRVGVAQAITVGGIEGRSVTLHSISPFSVASGHSQGERDWLVTVSQRDGTVIFMVFVAPQSHFERFQPTYEAMLKSGTRPANTDCDLILLMSGARRYSYPHGVSHGFSQNLGRAVRGHPHDS
jgi:hypothetical protein